MESVGSKWKKRDIEIITDYMVKSKITLWGDFGENFDPYLYKNGGPYIVIVTSTIIKEFRGELNFATTSASKLYVNLDIAYITSLVTKFGATSADVRTIETTKGNPIPPEEEMFLNRMTITKLLEFNWSAELQEYYVAIRAKIISIDNTFGWYYVPCNSCQKTTKLINGIFNCPSCQKDCNLPIVKFKIHVSVKEGVDTTTFVLFNNTAEKLLDTSAHKLFNRLIHNDDVPEQVKSLCGKEFIFKLKLNEYNLKRGLENFTVSKLFTPNEELELQYKLSRQTEAEASTVDICKPKKKLAKVFDLEKEQGDVSFTNLEDPEVEVEEHVNFGIVYQKRRKVIIDDDESSDEASNKCNK